MHTFREQSSPYILVLACKLHLAVLVPHLFVPVSLLLNQPSKLFWFAVCPLSALLQDLLSNQQRQLQMVLQEAQAAADKHGTPRRSRIVVSAPHAAAAQLFRAAAGSIASMFPDVSHWFLHSTSSGCVWTNMGVAVRVCATVHLQRVCLLSWNIVLYVTNTPVALLWVATSCQPLQLSPPDAHHMPVHIYYCQ
jgi:hypothetical protein